MARTDPTTPEDPFEVFARVKASGQVDAPAAVRHVQRDGSLMGNEALAACLMLPPRPGADMAVDDITESQWTEVLGLLLARPGGLSKSTADSGGLAQLTYRLAQVQPDLELDLLIRWIVAVLPIVGRSSHSDVDTLVAQVAAKLDADGTVPAAVDRLRDVVEVLPLERRSGRARLIAAVFRQNRNAVLDPVWWRSVTVAQLAAAADGALSAVLTDPIISEQVVRPRMTDRIRAISGRRAVLELMSYPAALVATLEPQQVRAALQRAADADDTMRAWLETLSESDERRALEAELSQAHGGMREAEGAAARAEALVANLRTRLLDMEQRMRDQRVHVAGARQAQQRQFRVDALRTAAEVAIAAQTFTDERSEERGRVLDSLTSASGLVRIGYTGQHVDFSRDAHELVTGEGSPRGLVVVVRPGYRLVDSAGDNVLVRAVVRNQREE